MATQQPLEESEPALSPGSVLGERYRIERVLGRGGMGEVYLAEHTDLGLAVAIKVANGALFHESALRRRFLQEARTASLIRHENVIDITDFGHMPNGAPFFVMEHLQGEELAQTLAREGRLDAERACRIAVQILGALAAAHAKGIVHRDIKPQNCFRLVRESNPDFIKVLDFGLAKILTDHLDEDEKTRSGTVMGTAKYMAPEQAKGEKVDGRADLYAVGVLLCQMLTGRLPFEAGSFMGMLHKHIHERPPSLRRLAPDAKISPRLDAAVLKALAKDPAERHESAVAFAATLRDLGRDASSRRRPWAWAAIPLAAAAAFTLVLLGPDDVEQRAPAMPVPDAPATAPPVEPPEPVAADAPATAPRVHPPEPVAVDAAAPAPPQPPAPPPEQRPGPSRGRGRKSATPAEATTPATPAATPEVLTDAEVRDALVAGGTDQQVRRCGQRYGGFPGESVRVTLDVAASGAATRVEVMLASPNEPMRLCIATELEKVRLPEATRGGRFQHVFRL